MPCPQVVENGEFGYFCNKNMAVFFQLNSNKVKNPDLIHFYLETRTKEVKRKRLWLRM